MFILITTVIISLCFSGQDFWRFEGYRPEKPVNRHSLSCVAIDEDEILCFGGKDEHGKLLGDLWRYDVNLRRWELIGGEKGDVDQCGTFDPLYPGSRISSSFVYSSITSKIYLFGGSGFSQILDDEDTCVKTDLTDFYVLSRRSFDWDLLYDFSYEDSNYEYNPLRYEFGKIPIGSSSSLSLVSPSKPRMYVFGGIHEDDILGNVWMMDLEKLQWQLLHDKKPVPVNSEPSDIHPGSVFQPLGYLYRENLILVDDLSGKKYGGPFVWKFDTSSNHKGWTRLQHFESKDAPKLEQNEYILGDSIHYDPITDLAVLGFQKFEYLNNMEDYPSHSYGTGLFFIHLHPESEWTTISKHKLEDENTSYENLRRATLPFPSPRTHSTTVFHRSDLMVFGGQLAFHNTYGDIWSTNVHNIVNGIVIYDERRGTLRSCSDFENALALPHNDFRKRSVYECECDTGYIWKDYECVLKPSTTTTTTKEGFPVISMLVVSVLCFIGGFSLSHFVFSQQQQKKEEEEKEKESLIHVCLECEKRKKLEKKKKKKKVEKEEEEEEIEEEEEEEEEVMFKMGEGCDDKEEEEKKEEEEEKEEEEVMFGEEEDESSDYIDDGEVD